MELSRLISFNISGLTTRPNNVVAGKEDTGFFCLGSLKPSSGNRNLQLDKMLLAPGITSILTTPALLTSPIEWPFFGKLTLEKVGWNDTCAILNRTKTPETHCQQVQKTGRVCRYNSLVRVRIFLKNYLFDSIAKFHWAMVTPLAQL